MNWMLLALVTIGAGIVTSLTDWFFAGDWLHRRWTAFQYGHWRQHMPDAIIVEDVTLARFAHREAIHFPLVIVGMTTSLP